MYTDMFGNPRVRLGLHHHSNLSDGKLAPEQIAQLYCDAGYDAIAVTDHWKYADGRTYNGITVLPGCEYDAGGNNCTVGVYHFVCLFADRAPTLQRGASAQQIIDEIHAAGGLAVLAHPAWSLNSPEKIRCLRGIDATEIYNAVSERGMSRRADSSLIVDMLACEGLFYPLFASDDSHYYGEGNLADSCTSFIMVSCDSLDPSALKKAILSGDFYASTGPEIHLSRQDNIARVDCSPVSEIVFMSNISWSPRVFTGNGLTGAEYALRPGETFIRAFVKDANGRQAWTNCIQL